MIIPHLVFIYNQIHHLAKNKFNLGLVLDVLSKVFAMLYVQVEQPARCILLHPRTEHEPANVSRSIYLTCHPAKLNECTTQRTNQATDCTTSCRLLCSLCCFLLCISTQLCNSRCYSNDPVRFQQMSMPTPSCHHSMSTGCRRHSLRYPAEQ